MPALTPEQEALKQAALAATPGPWFANESTEALHAVRGENGRIVADVGYSGSLDRDAENAIYLAAANPAAILALLAQLEAVQAVPEHIKYRWNIERQTDGSLLICENDHEKGEKCEYMRYVPSTQRPAQAVPDVLFTGYAVYEEITRKLGKGHCISAEAVSATLDAVVRLIRAAKSVPGDPAQ